MSRDSTNNLLQIVCCIKLLAEFVFLVYVLLQQVDLHNDKFVMAAFVVLPGGNRIFYVNRCYVSNQPVPFVYLNCCNFISNGNDVL